MHLVKVHPSLLMIQNQLSELFLPQNQQYLYMSNLRERVANIAETRK